jgi:hypothetical protein
MRRIGIAVWEVSVSVVKDSSGNGNNGVIHGATWADGKDYVLFGDAVSESDEARDIVHRAFTGLVGAGGCKIR